MVRAVVGMVVVFGLGVAALLFLRTLIGGYAEPLAMAWVGMGMIGAGQALARPLGKPVVQDVPEARGSRAA